ncbi:competence transcription factor [Gracilibacillus halophilus YIM-C55.5]|uniref:Competence transcription factor n=1 Tax=Gracilibacillus halophilus YIM-C55.5 TaxID=1308866 RepID=N4WR06_9BACI|nr:competence protein ComK [Gracilibacillus halophilus]ENH95646.1 competence transcription factor [Gracilibacillus halophilus YIM-C55.5]
MEVVVEQFFELSPSTLAVIGLPNETRKGYFTRVLDYDETFDYETAYSTQRVMDYTCREFGISLRGLIEGARKLSGITHKPPIAIDRISGMYFFPVESPMKKSCTWIAHSHVSKVEKQDPYNCTIIFKNGRNITLDISYASMINQLYRTAQYRYLLSNRVEDIIEHAHHVAERQKF